MIFLPIPLPDRWPGICFEFREYKEKNWNELSIPLPRHLKTACPSRKAQALALRWACRKIGQKESWGSHDSRYVWAIPKVSGMGGDILTRTSRFFYEKNQQNINFHWTHDKFVSSLFFSAKESLFKALQEKSPFGKNFCLSWTLEEVKPHTDETTSFTFRRGSQMESVEIFYDRSRKIIFTLCKLRSFYENAL